MIEQNADSRHLLALLDVVQHHDALALVRDAYDHAAETGKLVAKARELRAKLRPLLDASAPSEINEPDLRRAAW